MQPHHHWFNHTPTNHNWPFQQSVTLASTDNELFEGGVTVPKHVRAILRGGADKSLARPGRKQATATKLGIYSTYSPRSSIHFLARCSNFCKPLKKKKNQNFVRPTRSPLQQWPPRRKKNGDLSIVFSVQGTGGSPMGPDPGTKDGWPRYWKQR